MTEFRRFKQQVTQCRHVHRKRLIERERLSLAQHQLSPHIARLAFEPDQQIASKLEQRRTGRDV